MSKYWTTLGNLQILGFRNVNFLECIWNFANFKFQECQNFGIYEEICKFQGSGMSKCWNVLGNLQMLGFRLVKNRLRPPPRSTVNLGV